MEFLDYVAYGNTVLEWLIAVGIGIFVLGLAEGLKSFLVRQVGRLAEHTSNNFDDILVGIIRRTKFFFILTLAVLVGSNALELTGRVDGWIRALAVLATLIQLGVWGSAAITVGLGRYTERRMEEDAAEATTVRFVGFLLRLTLWVLVALVALDTAGIDITALVAGLGVGGIAVALAVQSILGDLFASLSIVLDKPFVIGDYVVVGDMMGTVEQIGVKTTRLRSLSGEQLIFSNNDLLSSRIRNYKRMSERRAVFRFGVTYQTSREQLERIPGIVRDIIERQENTRFDRAHFASYGDSSLDFEVVYFMLVPDYPVFMDTQQAVNLELYSRFEELGIDFAYPTRTVYVERDD